MINTASKSTYFFRWILSPDETEENKEKDLDLWKLARDGVRWLEERLHREGEIQLIGAEHNDHTQIPHIHAILLIERRGREKILTGKDLDAFRKAIHQMALDQRLTREQTRQQDQEAAETVQVVRENVAAPAIATPFPDRCPLALSLSRNPPSASEALVVLSAGERVVWSLSR